MEREDHDVCTEEVPSIKFQFSINLLAQISNKNDFRELYLVLSGSNIKRTSNTYHNQVHIQNQGCHIGYSLA
jgi:hypothetical protein